jgi:uncharacterized protein (DUF2235 family)
MKTIVFCADGTWGGPGQTGCDDASAKATNVFRLFVNLDGIDTAETALLANEQERVLADINGLVQCAKYIHGVGDSGNFLARALGGTLGAGLIARIVRGYTFISRNYVPGDRIVIVGFSRGAYTARPLAGLIAAKGLLDARTNNLDDKPAAYRMGSALWYGYRRAALATKVSLLGRLEQTVLDLPGFLTAPPPDDRLIAAPIEAVAVWDTVGSLGIPEFTAAAARVDAFRFADTRLSVRVAHGLHAVAVDELRADFTPTLWDEDPRVVQVLFPGAHSDVGGGHGTDGTNSGLSDCALVWMTRELARLGVRFAATARYVAAPQPMAQGHQPWLTAPWNVLVHGPRAFPAGLRLSQCLNDRSRGRALIGEPGMLAAAYAPCNLAAYLVGGNPTAETIVV